MDIVHIFAVNLKKYRREQGLSQEKLAELSDLHRTYISAVERERRNICIDNVGALAAALDIEPYQLFLPLDEDKK